MWFRLVIAFLFFIDEDNEKTVPVVLNGSESELVFSEYQFTGDTVNIFN